MGKQKIKPNYRRRVLRLPDLDHCKLAVLNSLGSPASHRVYEYAIDQFIAWYCSEPRLAFNRIVVVRYRMYLESRGLAANKTLARTSSQGEELRGLREDKLKSIQSCAQFLAEDAEYPAAAAFIPYLGQRWNPLFRESFGARRDRRR